MATRIKQGDAYAIPVRLRLSQEETFAFPANGSVALDVRVKFAGGDVVGVLRPEALAVYDAESEVVL